MIEQTIRPTWSRGKPTAGQIDDLSGEHARVEKNERTLSQPYQEDGRGLNWLLQRNGQASYSTSDIKTERTEIIRLCAGCLMSWLTNSREGCSWEVSWVATRCWGEGFVTNGLIQTIDAARTVVRAQLCAWHFDPVWQRAIDENHRRRKTRYAIMKTMYHNH